MPKVKLTKAQLHAQLVLDQQRGQPNEAVVLAAFLHLTGGWNFKDMEYFRKHTLDTSMFSARLAELS